MAMQTLYGSDLHASMNDVADCVNVVDIEYIDSYLAKQARDWEVENRRYT
jgi:hypothetical protein